MPSVTPHDGSRETLRTRVKLLATDFALLDELFPGEYPKMIVRGEGSVIWDDDGRELVDTGLHWGATNIGHGRKEIATAIAAQAERFEFGALYAGYGNAAVAELTERLASLVPIDDPGFAFSSSGSEANELAFHIARAYHARRGEPGRVKIISRSGG